MLRSHKIAPPRKGQHDVVKDAVSTASPFLSATETFFVVNAGPQRKYVRVWPPKQEAVNHPGIAYFGWNGQLRHEGGAGLIRQAAADLPEPFADGIIVAVLGAEA